MQFILEPCQECQKPLNGGVYRYRDVLVCPHCDAEQEGGKSKRGAKKPARARAAVKSPNPKSSEPARPPKTVGRDLKPAEVKLISKTLFDEKSIVENFGGLKTECTANIEITRDMFANGKFVGAKNKTFQVSYNQAKKDALQQLRREAALMGANAVAEVSIKYSVKSSDSRTADVLVKASGNAFMLKAQRSTANA